MGSVMMFAISLRLVGFMFSTPRLVSEYLSCSRSIYR